MSIGKSIVDSVDTPGNYEIRRPEDCILRRVNWSER